MRADISKAVSEADEWEEIMAIMREKKPEIAHLIGSLAGEEFDVAPELPMPPAKVW